MRASSPAGKAARRPLLRSFIQTGASGVIAGSFPSTRLTPMQQGEKGSRSPKWTIVCLRIAHPLPYGGAHQRPDFQRSRHTTWDLYGTAHLGWSVRSGSATKKDLLYGNQT